MEAVAAEDVDMVVTTIAEDVVVTATLMVREEIGKMIKISKVKAVVMVEEGMISLLLNAIIVINVAIM